MQLRYTIVSEDAVSRWQMTKMGKESFPSPKKAFSAEINLEESYVQIVYPVREEFLKQRKIEKAAPYIGEYDEVYFPFENNRIDLSTFIHTPHYLWVNARTGLEAPLDGDYPFEIYTCGGVRVWINGREQACFAPYTRNIASCKTVTFQLQKGYNEVVVYADELAERDVFFYFELRNKSGTSLYGVVDVDENPEHIEKSEQFLRSCYFERDVYTSGDVTLCYDSDQLNIDTTLFLTLEDSGTGGQRGETKYLSVIARHDASRVSLCSADTYKIRMSKIALSCKVGKYFITRNLFTGIIPKKLVILNPATTLSERKRQALNFTASNGENGLVCSLAVLETERRMTERARLGLDIALKKIEAHEDCADFSLAPLAILASECYCNFLTDSDKVRIKKAVLNFRYWIDEPGDDVMWYFSENHALLFHVSQYLWGNLFASETFTASGRTGLQQAIIGKQRLDAWFSHFFMYGYAEWNSATYIPIDCIGFFTLLISAKDLSIRKKAQQALDFTFRIIACNTFSGVMNSTYGRVYENNIKTRIQTEPNFLHWIAYECGYVTLFGNAAVLFSISKYEPPAYNRECLVSATEGLVHELDQGILRLKINTFRTADYLMAAVRRFKPFMHGHQQHVMNISFGKNTAALFYVNHPGERLFSGENRPSYWAGNGTMPWIERYQNITIMLFDIDSRELVHYIHAYAPLYEYDEYQYDKHYFFARSEDAYVGAWFSSPLELTVYGANTRKELISRGLKHAVIVKCGSQTEFGSFDSFKKAFCASEFDWNGTRSVEFIDSQYGKIRVKDAQQFSVAGTEIPFKDVNGFVLNKVPLKQL